MKTKTLKLQAYYRKLCEDEKASKIRNQQLLADLSSIETKFHYLEEKLIRLSKYRVKKFNINFQNSLMTYPSDPKKG